MVSINFFWRITFLRFSGYLIPNLSLIMLKRFAERHLNAYEWFVVCGFGFGFGCGSGTRRSNLWAVIIISGIAMATGVHSYSSS